MTLKLRRARRRHLCIFQRITCLIRRRHASDDRFGMAFSYYIYAYRYPFLVPRRDKGNGFHEGHATVCCLGEFINSFTLGVCLFHCVFFTDSIITRCRGDRITFNGRFYRFMCATGLLAFTMGGLIVRLCRSFLLICSFFRAFVGCVGRRFLQCVIFHSRLRDPRNARTFVMEYRSGG